MSKLINITSLDLPSPPARPHNRRMAPSLLPSQGPSALSTLNSG